jgi:hypothetical protein
LTLEEVDELYAEVKGINGARHSTKWVPTVRFRNREDAAGIDAATGGVEGTDTEAIKEGASVSQHREGGAGAEIAEKEVV